MNPTTKRLIDANELRSKAYSAMLEIANTPLPNEYSSKLALKMGEMFQKLIDDAPTVEVEPMRRGRWEHYKTMHNIVCSVCKSHRPYKKTERGYHVVWNANYCPNCGTKMEKDAN